MSSNTRNKRSFFEDVLSAVTKFSSAPCGGSSQTEDNPGIIEWFGLEGTFKII